MRSDKAVEKDEHGNEIVGDVIAEAFHADVAHPVQGLDGHLVGRVAGR